MQFAIMAWANNHGKVSVKVESIFGILGKEQLDKLPLISSEGHWDDFRTIDESQFKFAKEAKEAIAQNGYYLIGAGVGVNEAFGELPYSTGA